VVVGGGVEVGVTFNLSGEFDLLAIRLLLQSLARYGGGFEALGKRSGAFRRWVGDLGAAGKGEILVAR
jgi:hypothetical protein